MSSKASPCLARRESGHASGRGVPKCREAEGGRADLGLDAETRKWRRTVLTLRSQLSWGQCPCVCACSGVGLVPDMQRIQVEWFVPSQPCGTQSTEEAEDHSFGQEMPTEHLLYATAHAEPWSHQGEGVIVPSLRVLDTGGHTDMQTDLQRPEIRPPQGSTDQQGKPGRGSQLLLWDREERPQARQTCIRSRLLL